MQNRNRRVLFSKRFKEHYQSAPRLVQTAFDKQLILLELDLRYPSLHSKKYNEAEDIWQARVTRDWRFYFQINANIIYLVDIMAHPK